MPTYYLKTNNFWNVQKALIMKFLLNIFPTFWQSFYFQFIYFFVIVLQLKKSHFHDSNIYNIKNFIN